VDEVKSRFDELSRMPFPKGLGGEEVNGVELVLVDAEAAGMVQTIIKTKTISPAQYEALLAVHHDLNKVISDLPTHGRLYFQMLIDLVGGILLMNKKDEG